MLKVNVWQVGFTTFKDFVLSNKENGECRAMGYVEIDECENWEDEVWHLLNWGCWSYKDGKYIKPDCVHSSLDHCNSDVILQVEGSDVYLCAEHSGWGRQSTLERAIDAVRRGPHHLWPFEDVKYVNGYTKVEKGKAYISEDGKKEWKEITW